jgi:hypothetical protein
VFWNTCSGGHFVFFFFLWSSRYWRYHRKKYSADALHLFTTLEWDILKISTLYSTSGGCLFWQHPTPGGVTPLLPCKYTVHFNAGSTCGPGDCKVWTAHWHPQS